MISDRPYRRALPRRHALNELRHGAGEQFDPAAVAAVLSVAEDASVEADLVLR
jgi:HD-GYP domain-containing protein (c-di-GMP phosphodiesterase class II)